MASHGRFGVAAKRRGLATRRSAATPRFGRAWAESELGIHPFPRFVARFEFALARPSRIVLGKTDRAGALAPGPSAAEVRQPCRQLEYLDQTNHICHIVYDILLAYAPGRPSELTCASLLCTSTLPNLWTLRRGT